MGYIRLPEDWSEQMVVVSHEARIHLLGMISWCSRLSIASGQVREIDALRCSDVSDPARAISELLAAALLERIPSGVAVVGVGDYFGVSWRPDLEVDRTDKLVARVQMSHQPPDFDVSAARERICSVYRFIDGAGDVVYVGNAFDPEQRLRQHVLDKPWIDDVNQAEVTWHRSKAAALEVERGLIRDIRPTYNVVHNPRGGTRG